MSLSSKQSLLGRLHLHALAVVCTHFVFVYVDDVRFYVFFGVAHRAAVILEKDRVTEPVFVVLFG